ncbi:type III-B CRISPR-associated protein Cas10/Cmr2 [Candidatus Chloroploca sp. M-50]|uniref:Type III-B CRISPR-associated protein Cas10/Cmr2 n=1 Tax=Candidatus Chloroploca mongolica TaxID=2528176 RepID=A0ABS4DG92_9CHLR|nr:type III-B CRISPR-associated protein Cas10/Cmr2 [Candidatus Chloroploca mongolica]MBP1468459.1 type III-B CRISPR-associated protein Cas10/Cmr2 [Candidatus Chloroploca mongolica]
MQYLFLASIGPVQEFIASARRSRDLWFGSWLLSELSKAAALAIVQFQTEDLARLIFPAPAATALLVPETSETPLEQRFNAANRLLAIIEVPSTQADEAAAAVQSLASHVKTKLDERLTAIRDTTFAGIRGRHMLNTTLAWQQISDLVEYTWVALPLETLDGATYASTRQRLEAMMFARKATRNFAQVTWGETVPKSSLDGIRESVIPETAYPRRTDQPAVREQKVQALFDQYGAGAAERLSGVDLLKRHGQRGKENRFPSTSHFAALPLMLRLSDPKYAEQVQPLWSTYLAKLRSLEVNLHAEQVPEQFALAGPFGVYDGSLLFETRLVDVLSDETMLAAAQAALRTFYQGLAFVEAPRTPLPYYALLHADGDRMGQAIDHEAHQGPAQHRALSQALNAFATGVPGIVQRHHGAAVYAGGDDVMAFLPVHTALACARELADLFAVQLQPFQNKQGETPTLSVGLAVAHHIEPLADTLRLARKAEKAAKQVPGKNALAITLSKRSGVDRSIAGTWSNPAQREDDPWAAMDTRLTQQWIMLHRHDDLPDGAAYELRDLANQLTLAEATEEAATTQATLERAMRADAVRVLGRKRGQRGRAAFDHGLKDSLKSLLAAQDDQGAYVVTLAGVADEIILAKIFADACDLAEGTLQKGKELEAVAH